MTEPIEQTEEEPEEPEVDSRLKKMVNVLLKQVGEVKGLEGKTLEEQFDLLEFLAGNKPAPKVKAKNKPIVGKPTSQDKPQIGTLIYKNGDKLQMKFDPIKTFQPWKKK